MKTKEILEVLETIKKDENAYYFVSCHHSGVVEASISIHKQFKHEKSNCKDLTEALDFIVTWYQTGLKEMEAEKRNAEA